MKTETIISIIFIILFVVIPFLKEIFKKDEEQEEENISGESQSAQQVREYLEKMRASSGPITPQKSPEERLYKSKSSYAAKPAKGRGKKQDTLPPPKVEVKPTLSVLTESDAAFAIPPNPISEGKLAATAATTKVDIIHNIFIDSRFSEVQKALIFSEIFKTPSIFEKYKV